MAWNQATSPSPASIGAELAGAAAAAQAAAIAASQPADADLTALANNGAPGTTGLALLGCATPAAARTILEITPGAGGSSIYMPSDLATVLASGTAGEWERAPGAPSVIRLVSPPTFDTARAVGAADSEYGWTWINRTALSSADEDTTLAGAVHGAHGAGNTDWTNAAPTAAIRYHTVEDWDDLEVVGRVYSDGNADFERVGICIFNPASKGSFVQAAVGLSTVSMITYSGGSNFTSAITAGQRNAGVWFRITHSGTTQRVYYNVADQATPPSSWTLMATHSITGLALCVPALAVGMFWASTNASGNLTGGCRYFGIRRMGVDSPWLAPIWQAGPFPAAPTALLLVPIDAGVGSTFLPNQAAARLRCADIVNRLPGDAGAWVFSFTGSASAAPAAATTYQSAAALVFKDAGTDTTTTTPYRYWYLRAKCTSASGLQSASIDLSGLVIT